MTPRPTQRFHPGVTFVAATVKPMPPLSHTDASLASGPPFLAVAEPALLLLAPAFNALGRAVGDANAFDAFCFRGCLILCGVEGGVCRYQARCASEHRLMRFDGCDQQLRIVRSLSVDFIVDHNLVFGFLQFHHLAEFIGLGRLALANDFRR